MNRWILQMGFPVVTIDSKTGKISQKHFLLDPDSVVDRPSCVLIQLTCSKHRYKNEDLTQKMFFISIQTATNTNMMLGPDDWLVANIKMKGFYRVNYDLENWERLLSKLSSKHQVQRLTSTNRAQIIDDRPVKTTTKFLDKEREYMPWETTRRNLNYFILMFDRSEVYGPMQVSVQISSSSLIKPADNEGVQYNQVNAISMACSTGTLIIHSPSLISLIPLLLPLSLTYWVIFMLCSSISPNLKSTVYCSAIAAGGVEEWDFAWSMFKKATIASEAEKLMYALSCTKQPWLLNRYLEYCLDPEKIRKQDATFTITYIAANSVGQSLAWDFIRSNWDHIFNDCERPCLFYGDAAEVQVVCSCQKPG
uniref:ERAP1-like C-terminal domain-containing protein n=1 Tax=Labrus bergylta TaxID=56723 RepID=A0A3Q3EZX3_9LABR